MAESVLRGMAGESGVYEAAYVASSVTELPFFASKARCPAAELLLPRCRFGVAPVSAAMLHATEL